MQHSPATMMHVDDFIAGRECHGGYSCECASCRNCDPIEPAFVPPPTTPTPTVGSQRVSPPRIGKWDALLTLGLILGGWAAFAAVAKVVRMIVEQK